MIIRRLLKWHRRLPNNPQFDSSIEVFQSQSGYGIRATQDLPTMRTVIRVPPSGWRDFSADLSVNEAKVSNPQFYENLTKFAALVLPNSSEQADSLVRSSCLAVKLVIDKQESLRHPYIEFLDQATFPSNVSLLPHPLLMQGDEFGGMNCQLCGSSSHRAILLRRKMYNYIGESLFGPGNPTVEEFKWAIGVVLSRALSSALLEMPLTLVPVLDLVNHSFLAQNADHKYNKVTGEFSLVTTKDIKAGEEVLINYGKGRDTASFMSLYGFYDKDNRNDDVAFTLSTVVEDREKLFSMTASTGEGIGQQHQLGHGHVQQESFNSFRRSMSKLHGVVINPIAKKDTSVSSPISMRISSLSRLPLDFLLSLDKKEGADMLQKLLESTKSEEHNTLLLSEEIVVAAHAALGNNILAAARNVVSASIVTREDSRSYAIHHDGNKEPKRNDIVENEILAVQIMLASIQRNLDAFLPNYINETSDTQSDRLSPLDLIMAERAKSPSLIAAEARLQYLLDEGARCIALLSDPTRAIPPPLPTDLFNHTVSTPTLSSPTQSPSGSQSVTQSSSEFTFPAVPLPLSPSDAQLRWRISTSAVAARELDALLRLRSFCTAFLIALASSL